MKKMAELTIVTMHFAWPSLDQAEQCCITVKNVMVSGPFRKGLHCTSFLQKGLKLWVANPSVEGIHPFSRGVFEKLTYYTAFYALHDGPIR